MRHFNKLIISFSLITFLMSEGLSFRGKTESEIISNPIPLSFTNYISKKYDILPQQLNPERGSYLIIAPDGLVEYLNTFKIFKMSQGFETYIMPLSEAGFSPDMIKNSISQKLNEDPMLEYVLLVGDVDGFSELPSFYYGPENDVSDQKYTHINGNDYIPDVFIGRFSIDSLSDLFVMIAKTINYARRPLEYNSEWLNKALVVAGNYSNSFPIPITPKWTSYWLRDELLDYGLSSVDTVFYPPIQQGAPYIIDYINAGAGIINYRGWGDANGWHYPEFHVDDVSDLNNGWLTPVFMSYVCNSNDFANNVDPCFAEAVLRGGTPSVPKGGVAFVGPSDLHTSTKYNNIINAYMYDAMLNEGLVELGPALLAGQLGLYKEFPNQDSPGEAQEFYSHVYNILGDPSLQTYIGTPQSFNIELNQNISVNDGYLDIIVKDEDNIPVYNAVISILAMDSIISKGLTDSSGRFISIIELEEGSEINIYSNKTGFVQGVLPTNINPPNNNLYIKDVAVTPNSILSSGNTSSVSFTLENQGISTISSFNGTLNFDNGVSPSLLSIQVPELSAGSSCQLIFPESVFYSSLANNKISCSFQDDTQIIGSIVLEIKKPNLLISFSNFESNPETSIAPSLIIQNLNSYAFSDVLINLVPLVDSVSIELMNLIPINIDPYQSASTIQELPGYIMNIGNVSYGSELTFKVEILKNEYLLFSQHISLPILNNDITIAPPNNYGYWCIDDSDISLSNAPVFDWVELDPSFGGSGATEYLLGDDDHVNIILPFSFKYHGKVYEEMTINSNGWASFEKCYIDYFWNMSIPSYLGPKALLAPFWDDLEVVNGNKIKVYTYYDQINDKFIIEWSRALNGYDEVTEETFEIILHGQSSINTLTNDGVIDFQYLSIADVDVTKNYSTVGLEAPEKNYGTQVVFNNNYSPGIATLQDNRVYRFTTNSPDNYIAALELEESTIPNNFKVFNAYPNPFNPNINISIETSVNTDLVVKIYNLEGKIISHIFKGKVSQGLHSFHWDAINSNGNGISSGTYFLVVEGGKFRDTQKILFIK